MEIHTHFGHIINGILVALAILIGLSLLREPKRQQASAIFVGVAAGAYMGGGLGFWELPFTVLVAFLGFKGMTSYKSIGVAWVIHTVWDVVHHVKGFPMIPVIPTSSFECAITDVILSVWYWFGAPNIVDWVRQKGQK